MRATERKSRLPQRPGAAKGYPILRIKKIGVGTQSRLALPNAPQKCARFTFILINTGRADPNHLPRALKYRNAHD